MQLKTHTFAALGLGIACSFGACSGDGDGSSIEVRTVDLATAQAALIELTSNVDTTITGFNGARPVPATATATLDSDASGIMVQCAAGGMASVGGHVNVVPIPVSVDVQVAIDYNGCVTNTGTTLAGTVDFAQKVAAGPGVPVRVQTTYQGDIQFTGKIQASCPVDVDVLVDETGRAVQVSGTFCGQDASGLNLQIMPRWGR